MGTRAGNSTTDINRQEAQEGQRTAGTEKLKNGWTADV